MPYYNQVDPTEQYRGSGFDPMTGRLQGGQLVMQFMQQLENIRRKKMEEQWAVEDRNQQKEYVQSQIEANKNRPKEKPSETELKIRIAQENPDLFKTIWGKDEPKATGYDVPETEWPKIEKRLGLATGSMKAGAPQWRQANYERYRDIVSPKPSASGVDDIDRVAKEYRTKRNEIESRYNNKTIEADNAFRSEVAKIRSNENMEPVEGMYPSAYNIAIGGALAAKKRAYGTIEQAKKQEIDQLDGLYEKYLPGLSIGKQKEPKSEAEKALPQGFKIVR